MLLGEKIYNNRLPVIPEECTNSYIVFFIMNEKVIQNDNELFYGLMPNIAPNWWTDLVCYINTDNVDYLNNAKKSIQGTKQLSVFYPELLLNLNQQRLLESYLSYLEYDKNIIIKTNSPFIVQSCGCSPKEKKMIYLGAYKQ